MTQYKLIRSKRKTLAIHITPQAEVEVRAPLRMPQGTIDAFVRQKQGWVSAHVNAMRERVLARESFAIGNTLMLLGREYPAIAVQGKKAVFDGEHFLIPQGSFEQVRPAVTALYRTLAQRELASRVQKYGVVMGLTPSAVKISGARTRWGSCSGKNSLNFSWRLVLAHPDAVDYVVVHELAHIRQHNHSSAFWQVVEDVLPDYKRREKMLKALQQHLATQSWD
ncbi:SprT family zinc-dependent metalloprotease [Hydrogenoanaerobacterium sp.]|uniref:M48 family metallopeptidase n=1 Tax=Hydrogenoanaerobacterium sp. TaxID=2953763 RepID=UPI00289BCDF8|nr:SprT family zinc-dependent metalloprotease [Hydrogenoanaerobacterium sp.]